MKASKSLLAIVVVAASVLLMGCDGGTTIQERTNKIVDMGRMPMPDGKHQLHGYRLDNGMSKDHFVYVLEDNAGALVSGTYANQHQSEGKTSSSVAVTSFVPPPKAGGVQLDIRLRCASVEECQAKLAALQAQSNLK